MALALMKSEGPSRLDPLVVHPLPVAPVFLGRDSEIHRMMKSLETGGVLSLVGAGGSGKTATVERFLRMVKESGAYDALLVWSFYDDPDTNAFLRTAVEYLTGGPSPTGQGSGWFQVLKQAIDARPRTILVLDGLERVQRPVTSSTGIYGELEDPLLKALLSRIASSEGSAKALVTSRFPLSDLDRLATGYEVIDVNELPAPAAVRLLESHGVTGSKPEFDRVLSSFGRHALTVDLLGAAIKRFFGGQAGKVPLSEEKPAAGDRLAAHLSQVLRFFEKGFDVTTHDLMTRLCVFRFGVTIESLAQIFLKSEGGVAGSLAGKSQAELAAIAEDLAASHLLYNDAGRYSVHPAVRDHFYSLYRESAEAHGAITKHLLSLSDRPGVGLPTSKEALDLLEELVFHALSAGRVDEAQEIYAYRLGGNDHLNTHLGEYSRTHRILKAFPECPDAGGMYHCLRAFGDFDGALEWRPQNRYIQLAQGRLAKLADDPAHATAAAARFLMGEHVAPPERTPDFPITAAFLLALQGKFDSAMQRSEEDIRISLYADDIARDRLTLVDLHLRQGNIARAAAELGQIAPWVLSSGSQEHLCIFYHVCGRLEIARQKPDAARSALVESLQLAREAGFELFEVDILISLSRVQSDPLRAVELASKAVELSRKESMRYVWGEMFALSALAGAYKAASDKAAYRAALVDLHNLQVRVGHPDAARTHRALEVED